MEGGTSDQYMVVFLLLPKYTSHRIVDRSRNRFLTIILDSPLVEFIPPVPAMLRCAVLMAFVFYSICPLSSIFYGISVFCSILM